MCFFFSLSSLRPDIRSKAHASFFCLLANISLRITWVYHSKICAAPSDISDIRAHTVFTAQCNISKISLFQICFTEVSILQMSSPQISTLQMGITKVGTLQMGITKVGTLQMGIA